jgi:hypothetical protein
MFSFRTTKEQHVRIFTFDNTSEAYDETQTNEEISDGDVLVVPTENVVGYLVEAWPVAVTRERGAFHSWKEFEVDEEYVDAHATAQDVARVVGCLLEAKAAQA